MKKLLLPYAYDSMGNLIHIDDAQKHEVYKCPECGQILTLKISKIPVGTKNHRRNHFAHQEKCPDNNCTESFLHKLFKKRVAEFIRQKINNQDKKLEFVWRCDICKSEHQGNLLKKAVSVQLEYEMKVCRPDIALLDKDGNVVIVIEVVVTHKPEKETLQYYTDNKIACLQINVFDFADCNRVEEKLKYPFSVNLCPMPECKKCGHRMSRKRMIIAKGSCYKCGREMKIAMIEADDIYDPSHFTQEQIDIANANGANIELKYSNGAKESYHSNSCMYCNAFIGKFRVRNYYYAPHEKELDLDYYCVHCLVQEKQKIREDEMRISRLIDEKLAKDGRKTCPKCGARLYLRKSVHGYFYGCKNYPNCNYTENIILES